MIEFIESDSSESDKHHKEYALCSGCGIKFKYKAGDVFFRPSFDIETKEIGKPRAYTLCPACGLACRIRCPVKHWIEDLPLIPKNARPIPINPDRPGRPII